MVRPQMEQVPERPPNAGQMPSSFDDDPDFFNEARIPKIWRKMKEEPLVPIGCLGTSWALYCAYKAVRKGDSTTAQRMFRMRLYGQSFTLVAIVGGTLYYQADRMLRERYWRAQQALKEQERREKWIKELEARDAEDQAWRDKKAKMRKKYLEETEREEKEGREWVEKMERAKANMREEAERTREGRSVTELARELREQM